MKRNYLVMGMVTVAIGLWTSCAQTNVIDSAMETKGEVIGFSTYANKTRGVPIANNEGFAINGSTFGVTAFINGTQPEIATPYMGKTDAGAPITYTAAWNYKTAADARYWPTGTSETLDFYAYAPFTDDNRVAKVPTMSKADGMTFKDYTVPVYANQNDFMYASALAVTKSTNGATSDTLTLAFKHALTQILFKAKTSQSNLYVDIQKDGIELCNIQSKGTFTVNNKAAASWSLPTVHTNYIAPTKPAIAGNATAVELINTAPTSADALMLMPQTLTAWAVTTATDKTINAANTAHQSYLKIMCKIFHSTGESKTTPGTYENQVYLHGSSTGTDGGYAPLYVPFSSAATQGSTSKTAWEMGNKVTYTLIFGGGYNDQGKPILTPITFETAVDPWTTEATQDIDIKP